MNIYSNYAYAKPVHKNQTEARQNTYEWDFKKKLLFFIAACKSVFRLSFLCKNTNISYYNVFTLTGVCKNTSCLFGLYNLIQILLLN